MAGAGVSHGEAAGNVEGEGGVELVLEVVAGVAHAGADGVAALDHEAGDDAVEGGSVVEGLAVDLLLGPGVGPVLGALGEADEVGDGEWSLLVVELAGEAAHGGVEVGRWGRWEREAALPVEWLLGRRGDRSQWRGGWF